MNFKVMTLFPEVIESSTNHSILKKAKENNKISIEVFNIRDFSNNKHKKVDDYPFGGGSGMIMSYQPIYDCYVNILSNINSLETTRTIYLSPSGIPFNQSKAHELKKFDNIILLCGHYEGVDQRVIEKIVDEEISIGDYILTGGEIPAVVLIESVSRLVEGVLSSAESYENESFTHNLLEYPQYTRPSKINDIEVPSVLLSGNHKDIYNWRLEKSIQKTLTKRPDLLKKINVSDFSKKDIEIIKKVLKKMDINDIII